VLRCCRRLVAHCSVICRVRAGSTHQFTNRITNRYCTYIVQIGMHHTCLALRPTCGSFNCTTQLGQHVQLVADRPNTHAIIAGTSITGNTAISTRYIGGTLCDACLHNSRAAGAQRYAVVATLVYGMLPKCEVVARCKPGLRHATQHTLPCTRGSVVSHVLTCCGLNQDDSRPMLKPMLQWQHRTHKPACN
jgi:hypothetical protein